MKGFSIIPDIDIREMEEFLIPNGEYILPHYNELKCFTTEQLVKFGYTYAMYTLPTIELIETLHKMTVNSDTIEIGSGNGIIAKELNIRATDNYCQELSEVKTYYNLLKQPIIEYGKNVVKIDAETIAKKLKPDIILGSWITHKYDYSLKSGNAYGPNEEIILDNCKTYIMLGNEATHDIKPIRKHEHKKYHDFNGYITRSIQPEKNCVYIWKGRL